MIWTGLAFAALAGAASTAAAEVVLAKPDNNWEVFVNGRLNAFLSWNKGDGFPPDSPTHQLRGGGASTAAGGGDYKPMVPPGQPTPQGKIDSMRVRSGFLGNVFGFGLRRNLTEWTTVTGYMSIWMHVEADDRRKYAPVFPDGREGYIKLEGPWGALQAGRFLGLFSRGAVEVAFLYGHGFALGFPGSIDGKGPAAGHIGFGVLASGFAPGFVYATPVLAGLQLTAGFFEPAALTGSAFERTGPVRPEAELTFERPFGSFGKIKLFANGAWQKLYQKNGPKEVKAYGAGYGGRLELGPARLGVAGHYGQALGVNFALEPSQATYSDTNEVRKSNGYYAQAQLVLGRFDISAGYGATFIHRLDSDKVIDPATGEEKVSVIKSQTGISGVIVYHHNEWLHFAVDYFRADFRWWLKEKQVLNFFNAGPTILF